MLTCTAVIRASEKAKTLLKKHAVMGSATLLTAPTKRKRWEQTKGT